MTTSPPPLPKKRRRFRLLFLLLLLISLWQLVQRLRNQGAELSWSETPEPEPASSQAPTPQASQPASHEAPTPRAAQPASHETPATEETVQETPRLSEKPTLKPVTQPEPDFRYAVKWVDASEGADVPHEKRDLTLKQAQREAGWLAKHNRRFYPGEQSARSPFSRLQVWLQCVCGRDVVDLREPHTVPGEDRICPQSDAAQSHPQDVIVASR